MKKLSSKVISPSYSFEGIDWEKYGMNFLTFVAPTLAVFFGQLAMGVEWKLALPVAAIALWQSLADLFGKWKAERRA